MAGIWDGILGMFGQGGSGSGMLQGPMPGGQALDTTNPGILQQMTDGFQNHQAALLGLSSGLLGGRTLREGMGQGFANYAVGQRMDANTMKQKREEAASKLLAAYALKGNDDPGLAGALAAFPEASANLALGKLNPKPLGVNTVDGKLVRDDGTVLYDGGGDGGFLKGNSVEAQSINWLVKQGKLSEAQAADLGAGKTVTQADGSTFFITPQGLVGAPPGGQPQIVTAPGTTAPPVVPQAAPAAGEAVTPPPTPAPVVAPVVPQQTVVPPAPAPASAAPDGARQLTPAKVIPPTEAEKTNAGYVLKARESNKVINDPELEKAMLERANEAGSALPFNLGATLGITSPKYQQAVPAMKEFIAAVLRRESGASISPTEFADYSKIYFPQPGEDQTTVDNKRVARERAIEAMQLASGKAVPPDTTKQAVPPPGAYEWKPGQGLVPAGGQ